MRAEVAPAFFRSARICLRFDCQRSPATRTWKAKASDETNLFLALSSPGRIADIRHLQLQMSESLGVWGRCAFRIDFDGSSQSFHVVILGHLSHDKSSAWTEARVLEGMKQVLTRVVARETEVQLKVEDVWALRAAFEQGIQ